MANYFVFVTIIGGTHFSLNHDYGRKGNLFHAHTELYYVYIYPIPRASRLWTAFCSQAVAIRSWGCLLHLVGCTGLVAWSTWRSTTCARSTRKLLAQYQWRCGHGGHACFQAIRIPKIISLVVEIRFTFPFGAGAAFRPIFRGKLAVFFWGGYNTCNLSCCDLEWCRTLLEVAGSQCETPIRTVGEERPIFCCHKLKKKPPWRTVGGLPSLKLTVRTWKCWFPIGISFSRGLFSGAMLVLRRITCSQIPFKHRLLSSIGTVIHIPLPSFRHTPTWFDDDVPELPVCVKGGIWTNCSVEGT